MITFIDDANRCDVLRTWNGAEAILSMYHSSHRRLAIMLSRPGDQSVLFAVAVGSQTISGPVAWHNAQLEIERTDSGEVLRDAANSFQVQCSSVTVVTGTGDEFGPTFDDFIRDPTEP